MKSLIASTLLLGALSPLLAAPPANDTFANRLSLGSNATVVTSGSTVDATLEADENDLDSLGGASIWWTWTAPSSTTFSIDTEGSGIETALAVFKGGPTLDDVSTVGFNVASLDSAVTIGTSRLVFEATGGTSYHIAVHGLLGAEGLVSLGIAPAMPSSRVNVFTLPTTSVNVTSSAQNVAATLGIESEKPFNNGTILLHRPGFLITDSIDFDGTNRTAGNALAGTYQVTLPIPQFAPPGTWLMEVILEDSNGRETVFGRGVSASFTYDHALDSAQASLIFVTNTGPVDQTSPVLSSFSMNMAAVNVTSDSAPLTFTFRVIDDLSGLASARLALLTPSGEALTEIDVNASHRTLGTAVDGAYQVAFTFPPSMPSGIWNLTLFIRDEGGNLAFYDDGTSGDLFPGSGSVSFTVTGASHGYWAWMYPLTQGMAGTNLTDDFEGDGIDNLAEYAFGLFPDINDSSQAQLDPVSGAAGMPSGALLSGHVLEITYIRRKAGTGSGLTYGAQFSSTMQSTGPGAWAVAPGGAVTSVNDLFERVVITDPNPGGSARFANVRLMLTP